MSGLRVKSNDRKSASMTRRLGFMFFLASVGVLVLGALLQVSGTWLTVSVWFSFALVTIACALYLFDVVSNWITRRRHEHESVAGDAG